METKLDSNFLVLDANRIKCCKCKSVLPFPDPKMWPKVDPKHLVCPNCNRSRLGGYK